MSKDRFGNELAVGDRVAYVRPRYLTLEIGVITKITPKGATIDKVLNRDEWQIVKEVNNDKH